MTMFETVQAAAPDPILGLTEAFNADPNPRKINLTVGVYQNADGKTPILSVVKTAERAILEAQSTKGYKPICGDPVYGKLVRQMLFGADHPIITADRAVTAHTPGGTGALRVAGDYLHTLHPNAAIWMSEPTWPNHPGIFKAAGLEVKTYPYFDAETNALTFNKMIEALGQVPAGDVVLLHGCCHNPTGVDPTPEQWTQIGDLLLERGAVPLIDFAYQGFAKGIDEDAAGLRAIAEKCPELLVCSSFSKNFGLYNERVGALTLVANNAEQARNVFSQLKLVIRVNYSNPPAHGAAIVATIVSDSDLRARWEVELAEMRDRINSIRQTFVDTLKAHGVDRDFSFITAQNGMFSFSGLTKDQVRTLRDNDAIYIVGSGRINVAGITPANIDRLCASIAKVL